MIAWLFAVVLLAEPTPEERAVTFLAREVPQWRSKNGCYSCHNNGDAARALYAARRAGLTVPAEALRQTEAWLKQPGRWDQNGGDERFNNKGLARIQFSSALLDALGDRATDSKPLQEAAALVARDQEEDGSWKVGAAGALGSPVTYGPILATHFARRVLRQADTNRYADAVAHADEWLRGREPQNVLEAASLLLAFADRPNRLPATRRARCLELVRKGQDRDGGWGPFVNGGSEPFDTALVLLALTAQQDREPFKAQVARGRAYLVGAQEEDGGWPATTRPEGGVSYAQRISTTGWALLALLATREATSPAPRKGARPSRS